MQTKLRAICFATVASLLWIIPALAASPGIKVVSKAKKIKTPCVGTASWYGEKHQGRKMANGQRFDRHKLTAASWYFPLGTIVRVVNVKNGESVVVTITDRGPNLRLHRMIDLSEAAAEHLDYVGQGLTPVFVYPLPTVETQAARFDSRLIKTLASQNPGEFEAQALSATPM